MAAAGPRGMMAAVRLLPAAALVVVLAVAPSCSSDDGSGDGSGDGAGGADSSSALPSDADLRTYFGAVASYEVDDLEAAEPIAAEGSPALDYLHYQEAYATSSEAGGNPLPSAEAEPAVEGFSACLDAGEGKECVTWTGLEGEDGKLTDFAVNGHELDHELVPLSEQPPVSPDGLFTFQPAWAYRSAAEQVLFVLADVTAADAPVELRPQSALYIEKVTQLMGADAVRGPRTVQPGDTETVILAFPHAGDAELDGSVTVDLTVGGEPQTVGFGLTDPAD